MYRLIGPNLLKNISTYIKRWLEQPAMVSILQKLIDVEQHWLSRFHPNEDAWGVPIWQRKKEAYYNHDATHQWFSKKNLTETLSFQQWLTSHASFLQYSRYCTQLSLSSLSQYFSQERIHRILLFVEHPEIDVAIYKWEDVSSQEIVQVYAHEKVQPEYGILLDEFRGVSDEYSLWFTYQMMLQLNYQWINRQKFHLIPQQYDAPFLEIPFYFKHSLELHPQDSDFFLKEGLCSGWFSLNNDALQMGLLRFSIEEKNEGNELLHFDSKQGEYQLMMSPKPANITKITTYSIHNVSYHEFLDFIHEIPEFNQESPHLELAMVAAMKGQFFLLMDQMNPIASFCVERIGENFDYISYVSIIPSLRKTKVSSVLMQAIQNYSYRANKKNLVAVVAPQIVPYYTRAGYQTVGYWSTSY
jgi:hypothetical protein